MTIERVAIVGLGLIGGSVGLAVQQMLPGMTTTGWDADADVRQRAAGRRLVGEVCDTVAEAVRGADLVILCVCLLYTSPSPRDATLSRMPSSA